MRHFGLPNGRPLRAPPLSPDDSAVHRGNVDGGRLAGRLGPITAATTAQAQASGQVVSKSLVRAIRDLPVAGETRAGYDRAKFRLWMDPGP